MIIASARAFRKDTSIDKCLFPSRKRTEAAIASFALKPERCYERLLQIVKPGSCEHGCVHRLRLNAGKGFSLTD